jgi:hypothetical protein
LPRLRAEIEDAKPIARKRTQSVPPAKAGVGDSSAIRHPEHPNAHAPEAARAPTDDATIENARG